KERKRVHKRLPITRQSISWRTWWRLGDDCSKNRRRQDRVCTQLGTSILIPPRPLGLLHEHRDENKEDGSEVACTIVKRDSECNPAWTGRRLERRSSR